MTASGIFTNRINTNSASYAAGMSAMLSSIEYKLSHYDNDGGRAELSLTVPSNATSITMARTSGLYNSELEIVDSSGTRVWFQNTAGTYNISAYRGYKITAKIDAPNFNNYMTFKFA